MTLFTNQRGFSPLIVVLVVVVLAALGGAGYYVWNKNKDDKANSNTTSQNSNKEEDEKPSEETPDPYEGWKSYHNDTYGISFKYPTGWKVTEGSVRDPSGSATRQEYSISLERNKQEKYNETVNIEVLDMGIAEVEEWYTPDPDDESTDLVKTTGNISGNPYIKYAPISPAKSASDVIYLLDRGSKTYTFASLNGLSNYQLDSLYWNKFEKVFRSLELQ